VLDAPSAVPRAVVVLGALVLGAAVVLVVVGALVVEVVDDGAEVDGVEGVEVLGAVVVVVEGSACWAAATPANGSTRLATKVTMAPIPRRPRFIGPWLSLFVLACMCFRPTDRSGGHPPAGAAGGVGPLLN
jgi:hypothetical protein